MNKTLKFSLLISVFSILGLKAQETRYLDPIFENVSVESNVTYATNISLLMGTPDTIELLIDVYTPDGDENNSRPVIIVVHPGHFLPPYLNGQVVGSKKDSAIVNTCMRLAKRGYVAVAATYRLGWLPVSNSTNVIANTFIHAQYRGIQDIYSCVRYLRKTVFEENNPFGINPDKIGTIGFNHGGYLSVGVGYLDRYEEMLLPKFMDTETLEPYINLEMDGDPYGIEDAVLNMVNTPDYSSEVSLIVSIGGGIADTSWIEGTSNEPAAIGFHVLTDPYIPFSGGPVIIPLGAGIFVTHVFGTHQVINQSNINGNNDVLAAINEDLTNPLNQIVENYKLQTISYFGYEIQLGLDNMYPFVMTGFQNSPWDWWDKPTLDSVIAEYNILYPNAGLDADLLHEYGLILNPNMGSEQGNAYLDTIFAYMLPRACNAFGLEECMTVDVVNPIKEELVDFKAVPVPAEEYITLTSKVESPMRNVYLFDVSGKVIRSYTKVEHNQLTVDRNNLPGGIYYVKVKFKEGWLSKQVMFK